MFIKPLPKYNKKLKEHYTVYQLCESYRLDNRVRHRIIIGLGKLEDKLQTVEQIKQLGKRIEEKLKGQNHLPFNFKDEEIESLAKYYYTEIIKKNRYDVGERGCEWQTVDLSTLKNKDAREVGAEWLCKQAFNQLDITGFLHKKKWMEDDISLAATHIISRAVYPASELKTVSFIKENSAICELTNYNKDKITKDKLYKISHKLYSVKDELENYLSKRTNELFDLDDKIILYDLTNTYFEGRMKNSKLAKFGRSKEKRKDAKLIVLAVVVNREGFLKYSNIFEGNMTDSKTLETIVNALSNKTSFTNRKPIVVIDAGIATDENLKLLKKNHYDYMCVSRSNLKAYYADTDSTPVEIKDKREQPIELMKVKTDKKDGDNYLWVKSKAKALKENSMNGLLSQRFEEGMQSISEGISKKGGTKKLDKVYERIGRLKQKYPSVHKYYNIIVTHNGKGIATAISFKHKKGEDPNKKAGIYFLRTTLDENDEKTLWSIYNIIREIEYTFRVLKTDLDLRPIYHKTDDAAMAHLHLGILAYWLVATIRHQLKQKGYRHEWREIVRIMNTQKCVTTTVKNIKEEVISIRKCTEPTQQIKQLYNLMNYKYVPFYRKKSVVLPAEFFKNDTS
ncbi:MAG: IS1634 family transposase [Bacteroidetes bacterium]|nr:MAG: IS1634 family transposase [Bacteroidota bacterium]